MGAALSLRAQLRARLLELEPLEERPSRFGGKPAFWASGREVAHFEAGDVLDLRLTRAEIRARRADLAADPRASLRGGDWLELSFGSAEDLEWILGLARAALGANRGP